jgi:hypothetical protein
MPEPIEGQIYVPSSGQRIVMPGNKPDWPQDGQAVEILNPYQRRLVIDGDLVLKPDDPPVQGKASKTTSNAGDAQ